MTYSIPYTMIPGTKARAQEVNANFKYVTDSLDELSNKKMNTTLTNLTDNAIEVIKNLTCFRNIGETILSSIPLTDSGLHLLDGSLLQYGIYKEFIDYIADLYTENPDANYFCTETQWQTSVNTYGVCGKFVYDSTLNTVRLPRYSNKIWTQNIVQNNAPVVGNGIALGLTDGTRNAGLFTSNPNGFSGCLRGSVDNYGSSLPGSATVANCIDTGHLTGVTTDPTKSGLIAQLSNITTSLDGYYYIVIATSTKTEIQSDIDEIATDLNGKADVDLSNINASQSAKNEIISWGMPDYNGQIQLPTGTTEQTYTTPSIGFIGYNFLMYGNNTGYVKVNDITVITDRPPSSNEYGFVSGIIPVDRNDVIKYWSNVPGYNYYNNFQFYPMEGAN